MGISQCMNFLRNLSCNPKNYEVGGTSYEVGDLRSGKKLRSGATPNWQQWHQNLLIGISSAIATIWCIICAFLVHLIFWRFCSFSCSKIPPMYQNDTKMVLIWKCSPRASFWCIKSECVEHFSIWWFCTFWCVNSPPMVQIGLLTPD